MKTAHKEKGFTLLEVIITAVIALILARIVFASFNALNNRQSLQSQVDFIESTVMKVRNDALNSKNASNQSIKFATTSLTYDGITVNLANSVSLLSYTTGTNTISFYTVTGLPTATGTLIYQLKTGNTVIATSSIIINNLGIIE